MVVFKLFILIKKMMDTFYLYFLKNKTKQNKVFIKQINYINLIKFL
jgi:hypothetical protein